MLAISPTVQSVVYAVATKSVGSVFRFRDDLHKPPGVLKNTVTRESILLALTTLSTTAIQILSSPIFTKKPHLKPVELLIRASLTTPALFLAEVISRKIAPKKVKPGNSSSQQALWLTSQNQKKVETDSPIVYNQSATYYGNRKSLTLPIMSSQEAVQGQILRKSFLA